MSETPITFDLALLWYVLLGALLTVYAVLDGFDLGVGALHLFTRGDTERRLALNSIGPLWDGNEVWLVTFGGALFAAFPEAYATVLSTFYLPIMLLMVSLIGRAVSIELRSKHPSPLWRTYWDVSFALSSALVTFLFGVVAGDLILGLPLGADGRLAAGVRSLLHPYALAVGAFAVITSALHGALFLAIKTEGELAARAKRWAWTSFGLFLVAYLGVTVATFVLAPHALENFSRWPIAWVVVVLNVLAVANVPRALTHHSASYAFLSSSAVIAALCFLFGMAMFPHLVVSSLDPSQSLDLWADSSSPTTLAIMRNVALLGMPLVVTYTLIVHWVFRGKVKLGKFSY
jgi:cytochrome d ubiquinol oxidase subunit II